MVSSGSDSVFPRSRERSVNVSEAESLHITVSNLRPEETYSFRVVAYNEHGPGESSAPLKLTTEADCEYRLEPPSTTHWSPLTHGEQCPARTQTAPAPITPPGQLSDVWSLFPGLSHSTG